MCHIFQEQASAKNISIKCVSSDKNIVIDSDESILMQIMENLVSNAIKFTESGKSIVISISKTFGNIKMEVKDNGLGIPEDEMHLLFGKFQKLSSRPTGGEESTGLGLSIVKDLVEELGGKIWCESILGKGSTFIIELRS
jgi:two-component system sensor histidine kinase/response regulator